MKKYLVIGAVVLTLGVSGAALANEAETAGIGFEDYYEILSNGFTNTADTTQIKASSDVQGEIWSQNVGGSYEMSARLSEPSGADGPWRTDIGDNESTTLFADSTMDSGDTIAMQMKSENAIVDVEVYGSWASN